MPENTPPAAPKKPHEHKLHGEVRDDPWFWLREKDNPEVIEHLKAENRWTKEQTSHSDALSKRVYKEMLSRIQETDTSAPFTSGPWTHFSKTEKGKDYPVYCRQKTGAESIEVMLDCNALAEGHDYFSLGILSVSPDYNWLAYAIDNDGSERYTIYIKNLVTGEVLDETVPDAYYGFAWANDNKTFFYCTIDDAHRPWRVHRHVAGQHHTRGQLIFEEPDDAFYVSVDNTQDKEYVLIDSSSKVTSECHYISANDPKNQFRLIAKRTANIEYSVDHHQGRFIILTNDDAMNFKLCEVSAEEPAREHWKTIVDHRDDVTLMDFSIFKDHMVVQEQKSGLPCIVIHDLAQNEQHEIEFDEPVYDVYGHVNIDYETDIWRFNYTSLTTPPSVFEYNVRTRERTLIKLRPVLGGFSENDYVSERIWVEARDGAQVPVSLVYRRDLDRTRPQPMLLTGYGSYGSSFDVYFSSTRLSLLDRGIIFAIAHVRGGQEMGRRWYEDGKFLKKENTFNDFVDCAKLLQREQYTDNDRLAIQGGSAGGLLMGAVVNQTPELFKAVLAQVPFVDVVTTILDTSLPLSVLEWDEWGNPNDKSYYDCMRRYSPYDNVGAMQYPAMLVTAGLNDPRVAFWEPAKWVAKLREHTQSHHPIYLKTNMGAGHGGASGRYEALEELAFEYAFVIDQITDSASREPT